MPRDLDGTRQPAVLKAVHRDADAVLYWHLNARYLGSTQQLHHMEVLLQKGNYRLMVVDEAGNDYSTVLKVLD